MIFPNFITGPNTPTPLNLCGVAAANVLTLPAKLRQRCLHMLPRRVVPTSVMQFDYPTPMLEGYDERAEIAACRAEGTSVGFYSGAKMLPATRAARRRVLDRYADADTVIFDQVADDAGDSPEADLIRQCLAIGLDVGLEANARQDWISALMQRYGDRVTIFAQWWLWEDTRGRRYTTDEVKEEGACPVVLVSRFSRDDDAQRAIEADPARWADFRVTKALEWSHDADVTVRMVGMDSTQLARLEAANP